MERIKKECYKMVEAEKFKSKKLEEQLKQQKLEFENLYSNSEIK